MKPDCVVGWDIGGAHVKAAVIRNDKVIDTMQFPCPLWQGLDCLQEAIDRVLEQVPDEGVIHGLTMTGELVDLFPGRDEGVRQILLTIAGRIEQDRLYVFVGLKGILPVVELLPDDYAAVASANWLACGVWLAQTLGTALFVDVGSTTTDILCVEDGEVKATGLSDYDRLVSAEMVYTGIVRTPLAALVSAVSFEGNSVPLIAELFATTADIYRLTGDLEEQWDQFPPADGGEKTIDDSARRLARMIGRDLDSAPMQNWKDLAVYLRDRQLELIELACVRQLSRLDSVCQPLLVGAGVGRFLVKTLSSRFGLEYRDYAELLDDSSASGRSSDCAPAASVARLLERYSLDAAVRVAGSA